MEISLLNGRKIGDGHPPYIIAEVGSNWRTLEDCMNSVSQAKLCGADAVKFQLFNSKALYGFEAEVIDGKTPEMSGAMPPEWLPKLKEKADAVGIDFMCTAFSPELYDVVNPFVSMHKVASAEMCHVRILEKVRSYGKPVILSTGAQQAREIEDAIEVLGHIPFVLMYCVAAYPAKEVQLELIEQLESDFGSLVGYSDHTTDVLVIPRVASIAGACVIEKHFTVIPETETPDRTHSLNPSEFKRMVASIRGDQQLPHGPTESERPMVTRHKRRLIATRDIAEGEPIQEGQNFGIYRSLKDDSHAFGPFMINEINGTVAAKAIKAGDGIGPGDFLE